MSAYRWRAQSNADHLARAFDAHVAEHGRVCMGIAPSGRDAHPSAVLEPVPHVPLSAGGRYDGRVLVLCPFCRQRHLAIVAEAIDVAAAIGHAVALAIHRKET